MNCEGFKRTLSFSDSRDCDWSATVPVATAASGMLALQSLISLILLCLIASLGPSTTVAQTSPAPRIVVVLYWYDKDYPWNVKFDTAFQTELRARTSGPVEFYAEYLETNRFPKEKATAVLHDYLQKKYADRKVDAVVAASDASLELLTRYRADLFTSAPLIFVATKRPPDDNLKDDGGETGIININAYRKTLDLALKLHPETEQVFIVSGTLEHDQRIENLARAELHDYESRIKVNYLTDISPNELVTTAKTLPNNSLILYVWQQAQAPNDKVIESSEILGAIAQDTRTPIYKLSTLSYSGGGVVGGYLNTAEANGERLAEIVSQIFAGTPAQNIPVESAPSVPVFDWRELQRFEIAESQLPTGSIVQFKPVTFWSQYKGRILVAISIILIQALLIAGLLFERNRKKHATARLSESEQRFAKAFKANPQPMSLTTLAEGRYLDVNESFLRMSGYTRDEVLGRSSLEMGVFESLAQRAVMILGPLLEKGAVRNVEMKFPRKDGTLRTLLSSAELLDLSGEKCVLVASSDITDRKELQQELQRSEREFSTLVENSPDIISRLDKNLRYLYISPSLESATGWSRNQFIGKTPTEVSVPGYDARSFEASCREALATKKTINRAFEYDGRNYYTRIVPELTPGGKLESVMTISVDVTERVRAEEELTQLTAQLFRLQDEERRKIARDLHDGTAQNLFAISINLAKLGQLDAAQKQEMKRLIAECTSLGDQSLQEIRTMSYLLHPPLLDQVGLVGALNWYIEGFSKRSGIYVGFLAQPIDRLSPDVELALFRVVQESLTNVLRHSGSKTATIRLQSTSGEVVLEIEDRGRGIDESRQTTKSAENGEAFQMGVGIPGMQQRLRQLGGELQVSSNGHGTNIIAVVPTTNGAHHVANSSR